MTPIARTVSLSGVFIFMVLSLFVYSVLQTPQLSDEELRDRGVFLLPRPRDLAPFELLDDQGALFDNQRLLDNWTCVFFGFTHCPDVCPTTLSVLGQVDAQLRQEGGPLADTFQAVLVTVDPERDTADELGPYARAFSPRFYGVLGDRTATAKFAQQVNAAFAKVPTEDGGYSMDHTGNVIIINPRGHYHGFIKLPHKVETIRLAYQSLAARF
jgi:protein SCO1/2